MTTQTQEKSLQETIDVSVDNQSQDNIKEAFRLVDIVRDLKINTNQEYQNLGEFLKQIKTISGIIEDSRKSITKPLDEAKRRIMDFFRNPLDQLSQAERLSKNAMITYTQEQARIARKIQLEAEAKAKAEESRQRKMLEERAKKAQEKGNLAKAEMLKEKAEDVYVKTPVISTNKVEKVQGISIRKVWKAHIKDFSKVPPHYYINDDKVRVSIQAIMNKLATATKGSLPIAGVCFYQEDSISSRMV